MIPFLICSFANLGKNISLLMNKKNNVSFFNILYRLSFLLYWFGFLIYWCYTNIINKDYSLLLFSLPFWGIGVYMLYKHFLKKNNYPPKVNSKFQLNFKLITGSFLVIICLLSGITMLFFGIKDTYQLNHRTKNYITTDGYFDDYEIYNSDEEGTTYKLTYIYTVDEKEYTITTDYGTNYIPDKNSIRTIKYNPDNPKEAILVGTNSKTVLIFLGGFFTFGALTFILAALSILGYFDKFKIDIVGSYIGALFLVLGIGIILFQNGTTSSLIKTIKSFSLWILIPFMFIIVGIFQLIKSLFFQKVTNK